MVISSHGKAGFALSIIALGALPNPVSQFEFAEIDLSRDGTIDQDEYLRLELRRYAKAERSLEDNLNERELGSPIFLAAGGESPGQAALTALGHAPPDGKDAQGIDVDEFRRRKSGQFTGRDCNGDGAMPRAEFYLRPLPCAPLRLRSENVVLSHHVHDHPKERIRPPLVEGVSQLAARASIHKQTSRDAD